MEITQINIIRRREIFGSEGSIEDALRQVPLRGYPQVQVYSQSNIKLQTVESIGSELATSQPYVFADILKRLNRVRTLFEQEGVDIFNLDCAYDYVASYDGGGEKQWTMMPPVVERISIGEKVGRLDYTNQLDERINDHMRSTASSINPRALEAKHFAPVNGTPHKRIYSLVADGSHRVHLAFLSSLGINVIEISDGWINAFPYQAIPQPYNIEVVPTYADKPDTKVRIFGLDEVNYAIFREFQEAGIHSGSSRHVSSVVGR